MSGLIERAKRLLGGKDDASPPVEPFAVRCPCGVRIEGLRRETSQVHPCPECGAAVFVFPRSPLTPPGPARKSKTTSAKRLAPAGYRRPEEAAAQIDDEDFNLPPESAEPKARSGRPAIMDRRWRQDETGEEDALPPRRPLLTRTQRIIAGVLTLICIGGFLIVRQQQVLELRKNLPERARRGLQFLAEGKFLEARDQLRQAVRALDWLKEPLPEAAAVRQGYAESSIVVDLLPEPLESALQRGLADPHSFAGAYRGQALLLDVQVEKDPNGGWQMHALFPAGDATVHLHPDGLKVFDDMVITGPTRCLLGVRIEGLVAVRDQWFLRLQPDAGVLLTEPRVVEQLGLGGDVEAEKVRERQARLVAPPN